MGYKIVIDTNVVVTALRSKRGASNVLLQRIGANEFTYSISVPLVLEYEAVIKRLFQTLSQKEIDSLLDYLCAQGQVTQIYYLWRPKLPYPSDDMILELAVASRSDFIVTYNQKDFRGVESFGIQVVTPKTFLTLIGALS